MKQLGRKHVGAEARPFSGGNAPLVRLVALGYDMLVMDHSEAIDLASQLVAVVDGQREGIAGDGRR